MTESVFIRKLHVLIEHLIKIYYDGEEIDGDAKAIELLCHNFIEIKKLKEKEENKI